MADTITQFSPVPTTHDSENGVVKVQGKCI